MLDRQKVEAILGRRFPGAARDQVAAAVNAIMGLSDEWEEVLNEEHWAEFRLFRRRETDVKATDG
jgi:hypothetical protein